MPGRCVASAAAVSARPPAILQQAAGLMNLRRFAEAKAMLQAVVMEAPDSAMARRLLGAALRALGDHAGAERELRAALSIDPACPPSAGSR